MKKLSMLVLGLTLGISSSVLCIVLPGFTKINIKNEADRDVWVNGWGKTKAVTCSERQPGTFLPPKWYLPFIRLENGRSVDFYQGDVIKIRYYLDPKTVTKADVANNVGSEKIVIKSVNPLIIEGGNFEMGEKD